jgi:hypothetical protein
MAQNPTPSDLYGVLEHVLYEMSTFAGAIAIQSGEFNLGVYVSPEHGRAAVQNMLVEVRALHARNLAEFFTPSSYVQATDFLPSFGLPEGDMKAIKAIYGRASREVAHLTFARVSEAEHKSGAKSKSWPPEGFSPLLRACKRFGQELLCSHWVTGEGARYKESFETIAQVSQLLLEARPSG